MRESLLSRLAFHPRCLVLFAVSRRRSAVWTIVWVRMLDSHCLMLPPLAYDRMPAVGFALA
jgi:hypothetical protein